MTVTAGKLRSQSRDEVRAEVVSQLAADHVRLIAGQLWLADRLAEFMPNCCPATAGVWDCPHRCVVTAPGSEAKLRDCWLAAVRAQGTQRTEVSI